ncbi:class I SAM-dependent methyltransferase [Acidisphaera sp. L21]|uniref:class I SAM-dependent methyltransferase n=1 Tax=Acidisphaera sp. L21 TaxID=1641851 RepID=UPI00131B1B4A|nr:class I SAM-dependent methyltransferase [Acidisphaera sp. L21]
MGIDGKLVPLLDYHGSRLQDDPRRKVLWESLWRYHFKALISPTDCVLDLGSGYGSFINAVTAARRIAVDSWAAFPGYLQPGVEYAVAPVTELDFIADRTVDFAFASNLFEHLTKDDICVVLAALRRKLALGGSITIVQPNYRYAFREYFDDYDHKSIFTHISLADFLMANGYDVFQIIPRFMPLSIKSQFPVSPWLIRAWLASPVKPLGKQMLIRARPRSE